MDKTIYQTWRNECETSTYPFGDNSLLVATNGVTVFPADALVDMSLYPIGSIGDVYMSTVEVTADTVTLTIADSEKPLCTAVYNIRTSPDWIDFADSWGRPAGMAVVDAQTMAQVAAWQAGVYYFTSSSARVCGSAVIPTPEVGVRGFLMEDGEFFTGHVILFAEDGISIQYDSDGIRVDATGDPLFLRKDCEAASLAGHSSVAGGFDDGPFLQTINGIPGGPGGDFVFFPGDDLTSDSVVRIMPEGSGLRITLVATGLGR